VTVKADISSTMNFPRYCSMCLRPFPSREYQVSKSRVPWTGRTIATWSVNVPICTECYKTGGSPVQIRDVKEYPPEATFWFGRQQYGEMFVNTNAGIVIRTIVTPDEPIPVKRPVFIRPRKVKIVSSLVFGIAMLFGGVMSLAAYTMYGEFFNLVGGSGLVLSGVLAFLGGFFIHRGNQKRGNLLIIFGFVLLIFIIVCVWFLTPEVS